MLGSCSLCTLGRQHVVCLAICVMCCVVDIVESAALFATVVRSAGHLMYLTPCAAPPPPSPPPLTARPVLPCSTPPRSAVWTSPRWQKHSTQQWGESEWHRRHGIAKWSARVVSTELSACVQFATGDRYVVRLLSQKECPAAVHCSAAQHLLGAKLLKALGRL